MLIIRERNIHLRLTVKSVTLSGLHLVQYPNWKTSKEATPELKEALKALYGIQLDKNLYCTYNTSVRGMEEAEKIKAKLETAITSDYILELGIYSYFAFSD